MSTSARRQRRASGCRGGVPVPPAEIASLAGLWITARNDGEGGFGGEWLAMAMGAQWGNAPSHRAPSGRGGWGWVKKRREYATYNNQKHLLATIAGNHNL